MSNKLSGLIFDIKKFSIHDGPGIRTTIFLKGCPLHCAWCHNPEGISPKAEIQFWEKRCIGCFECVDACQHKALIVSNGRRVHNPAICQRCGACAETCPADATEVVGVEMSITKIMEEIEKDLIFYDQSGGGVTFSGGEPLLQIDFLEAVLNSCHDHGIHTAVDTSGNVPFESMEKVLPFTDLFLYDIKCIDPQRHIQYTGVPNHRIITNLRRLASLGAEIIPRIPIIPGINDDEENIHKTGALIAEIGNVEMVSILPYHRSATSKYKRVDKRYPLESLIPPSQNRMLEIAQQLEYYGFWVTIGG